MKQQNRKHIIGQTSYALGWRPPIPLSLSESSPELVQLIKEMWSQDMFARPAMRDVVSKLENIID